MAAYWKNVLIANRVSKICLFVIGLLVAGVAPAEPAGIFYECRLEGQSSSYLLGTMHASEPRVLAIADKVEPYLKKVDRLALEIVPDGQAMLAALLATQLPSDTSLEELLSATLYRETRLAMAQRGVPESVLQRMRPWAVSVELSLPHSQKGVFLDLRIFQLAQEAGKALVGLETVDEQLGLFDELTMAEQIALLEHAVKNLAELPKQFNAMVDAYVSGDLEALSKMADEQQHDLDEELVTWFDRKIVENRNRVMAERAWPLIKKGDTLVAVGALHLIGDTGLVANLRQRGCNFRRLR